MIEQVDRATILPIRHSVLRPGLPMETAMYPEDDHRDVFHLAITADDGATIGCVTFFPDSFGDVEPAWRLRGMAVLSDYQGRGLGGELLEAGVARVAERSGARVWCHGRSAARAFYERHGFRAVGDEYLMGVVNLPHFDFVRDLAR